MWDFDEAVAIYIYIYKTPARVKCKCNFVDVQLREREREGDRGGRAQEAHYTQPRNYEDPILTPTPNPRTPY